MKSLTTAGILSVMVLSILSSAFAQEATDNSKAVITIQWINAGDSETFTVQGAPEQPIREITLTAKENIGDATLTLYNLPEHPSWINKTVPGTVYKYVETMKENFHEWDLEKIAVMFEVNQSWLQSNNINESTIKIFSWNYNTGEWDEFETLMTGTAKFEAEGVGLSIFAISGESNTPSTGNGQTNSTAGNTSTDGITASSPAFNPSTAMLYMLPLVAAVIGAIAYAASRGGARNQKKR